jgi:GH15 family glucan-1,4-alpha-glucosidase
MNLEDYGFIGDTQTAALVGIDGSIDWMCLPRFDSGAAFAALLGDEQNGCWRIAPAEPPTTARHSYRPDTLILETEFETDRGTVRITDCMPPAQSNPSVVRIVEGIHGTVDMEMKLVVRFDYGITVPWVRRDKTELVIVAGPNALVLRSDVQTRGKDLSTVAEFTVAKGERRSFVLSWYPSNQKLPETIDPRRAVADTHTFWEAWVSRCTYRGEWRDLVVRSLITLKALTYSPTGGIVAAATTSLPEQLGGERNWDYRACWLRDATLALHVLLQSGFAEEASAWIEWLLRAIAGDPDQMRVEYGPCGERSFFEFELKHLPGYEKSRPVRVGNAAANQFQLDVYGEVLDAMHLARKNGIEAGVSSWPLQRHLVEFVAKKWREPDSGLWEVRGPRRQFTHSKVMAWVAIDRAVKAVEQFGLEGELKSWKNLRQLIHEDVCANGYNPRRKAFTQYYGSNNLDASVLVIPLVGFLPASDERMRSTIELIQKELVMDGFVLRYRPDYSAEVNGLPPGEGSFSLCSFWLVDCLYLLGQSQKARHLFMHLTSVSGELGLFSEEYDPKKRRQLGNFPQTIAHVGLINCALSLSHGSGAAIHRGK